MYTDDALRLPARICNDACRLRLPRGPGAVRRERHGPISSPRQPTGRTWQSRRSAASSPAVSIRSRRRLRRAACAGTVITRVDENGRAARTGAGHARPHIDAVQAASPAAAIPRARYTLDRRRRSWQRAAHHHAERGGPASASVTRPHRRRRACSGCCRADRGQAGAVPVQPGAGHARARGPLQDTPWVRSTYTATLRAPPGWWLYGGRARRRTTRRDGVPLPMPQPIPSYLLALAVGDLGSRPIGAHRRLGRAVDSRCRGAGVRGHREDDRATEALYGPYRWGRYDLLVLPPSFPYGGMENPRLTFMTPTVIAGDKSLVGAACARTGAFVVRQPGDQRDLERLWLNEGFTTYFERRIIEAVYGDERARMEWGIGLRTCGHNWRNASRTGLA